jgi:hypothetical protein
MRLITGLAVTTSVGITHVTTTTRKSAEQRRAHLVISHILAAVLNYSGNPRLQIVYRRSARIVGGGDESRRSRRRRRLVGVKQLREPAQESKPVACPSYRLEA